MKTVKLKNHESAQARVTIDDEGNIDLVSYCTTVIIARNHGNVYRIECTGTYSRTTAKHIGWFLRDYFPALNYYDMKRIAGTGIDIEIAK
jgi:hypothetical protein